MRNFELTQLRPSLPAMLFVVALLAAVAPLWATQQLPIVDLPQHLHLITVLHNLGNSRTLYPEYFAPRAELTPYLGYYYSVAALSSLVSVELANRIFLSLYVAGLPLSLAFLLRSLRRPAWPALLAVPFAYGDNFAWGFINTCAALPLAILSCGLLVRALEERVHRRRWALALAASSLAVLLFHVQVFLWLGMAVLWLSSTTKVTGSETVAGRWHRLQAAISSRRAVIFAILPSITLCIAWAASRLQQPTQISPGQPWKAWGPALSAENLSFKTFAQNCADFMPVLSGMLPGDADRWAVVFAFGVAGMTTLLALASGSHRGRLQNADWRPLGLAVLTLALFFLLPFDVRGFIYYLNTRYAQLAAALLVVCVPILQAPRWQRLGVAAGVAIAVLCGVTLAKGFASFDQEARQLQRLLAKVPARPRIMGLIYDAGSSTVTHPVYLHAAAVLARQRGGIANFSFAMTPHSPLRYRRGKTPPTFASEWHPETMQWHSEGIYYDTFLLRGRQPLEVFGARLDTEVHLVAQAGDFWLLRRR